MFARAVLGSCILMATCVAEETPKGPLVSGVFGIGSCQANNWSAEANARWIPAMTAIGKGYEAYVPVDACGTFSQAKHEAGLLRMQQAGVILSDYATLAIEILGDNSRPDAGSVYAALAMPFAVLVGQIAHAYGR